MATSKFEKRFTNSTGSALLGATIEIVPQANTYPTGKIVLNEHPTRAGWYYKDGVTLDEYKIYINGSLYTQHIFHPEMLLKYIAALFDEDLAFTGEIDPARLSIPNTPPSSFKIGNIYYDVVNQSLRYSVAEGNIMGIKSIRTGRGVFVGTATSCVITLNQVNENYRYTATPEAPPGAVWNANDRLSVYPSATGLTVERNAGGTSDLAFHWLGAVDDVEVMTDDVVH